MIDRKAFQVCATATLATMTLATMTLATMAPAAMAGPADPVIAAERAFAAEAAARGWVAAFKTYAAGDAIVFQPDAVNAQTSLARQPDAPADTSLQWWPVWAGIAASGDLGFTTGPYAQAGVRKGHYFTVWSRQGDGAWRWIFDGGPRNDASLAPDATSAPIEVTPARAQSGAAAWDEVAAREAGLAGAARTNAIAAYQAVLADDARLMGSPAAPATDAASRAAELDRRPAMMDLTPVGGRASQAGDLVFTYGTARWSEGGADNQGHTVRIWQKRGGRWMLIFDELLVKPRPTAG